MIYKKERARRDHLISMEDEKVQVCSHSHVTEAEFEFYISTLWAPNRIKSKYWGYCTLIEATQEACKVNPEPGIWDIIAYINLHKMVQFPNTARAFLYNCFCGNDVDLFNASDDDIKAFLKYDCIPTEITQSPSTCVLCLDDMPSGTDVYVLPGCKHTFHACEEDCLGTYKGIVSWLIEHKHCPVCRQPAP